MKHLLLTTIATVLLVGTAFAGPIHVAAEDGDLAGVQAELDKGVDVNVNNKLVGSGGGTPLHYATTKAIAELLIANGADVNAQNDYGETPLDYDAWYNSETEIADLLREHGGKHGVINGAAAGGDIEAVKEFLVAGTDVNVKDGWGWTPLHNAAWWGHKEIAELLLANGADVDAKDEDGYTPLHFAGNKEVAKLLIAEGADVDAKSTDGSIPLHGAAFWGLKEVAELLIAKGADVNAKDYKGVTPLHDAALWGHKEIAELLLANGADVNAKDDGGDTPLDVAILRNDKETADLLRKHGGKTTEELEEIFHAIEDGDFEAVNKAISDGFDFNNAIFEGQTPLHMAADLGYKEIVELLLTNGADVNAKDYKGVTPLLDAATWGYKEVVELLLAKGADVNAKANDGKTPLDWAIEKNRTETADLLRKHGGKTGDELALMPHLVYAKGPFGVSFTAKDGETYVVEVTQDLKQWGELETIKGTGKQVKFTDPRQPLVPFKRNFYRVKLVE